MTMSFAPWRNRVSSCAMRRRVAVGRVGADDDDDVRCSTESKSCVPADVPKVLDEAIARRGVADAGAGIDIVVAEAGADQLLDDEDSLRWCNATM
jgi:hypothetical protein